MKVAIYSENLLGNSGGAEIYALKIAECLEEKVDVTIFTVVPEKKDYTNLIEKVFVKYNVPKINVCTVRFNHYNHKVLELFSRLKLWFTLRKQIKKRFDLFINCSCNRMFGFSSTKSVHLIHFPVQNYIKIFGNFFGKILNLCYTKSYYLFLSNSLFTKEYLKLYWDVESTILNPPICMEQISYQALPLKEDYILAVGRIVPDKQILFMINSFIKLKEKLPCSYKFVIIGNSDTTFTEYFDDIKKIIQQRDDILLLSSINFHDLVQWYRKAKIFWHAKGINVVNPLEMEHFGMTTVEAMVNGCVPVVINKGGQIEIVSDSLIGFLWNSEEELIDYTIDIISKKDILFDYQRAAIERAKFFLFDEFKTNLLRILKI